MYKTNVQKHSKLIILSYVQFFLLINTNYIIFDNEIPNFL